MLSVNERAVRLVEEFKRDPERYRVKILCQESGATIVDAGLEARGGYTAGALATEICLGGLGKVGLISLTYGDIVMPTIHVVTDHPAIATLGSQFAGWNIQCGKYFAMGSGPGRALALKPKELYKKIEYRDDSDNAVLVLEAESTPPAEAIELIATECNVKPGGVSIVLTPTSSIAGSTQVSGRIVELGVHRLTEIGLDPKRILSGAGYAPIPPVHPKPARAIGRTNDALYYGGLTVYTVDFDSDEGLAEIVRSAPSCTASDYGKQFYEIFKTAQFDFYRIDPKLFAPAQISVTNVRTGNTFTAGGINPRLMKETMGLASDSPTPA